MKTLYEGIIEGSYHNLWRNRKVVVVGLDGALSDNRDRLYLVTNTNRPDWNLYFARINEDEPYEDIVARIDDLHKAGHFVIILTGRPEEYRWPTELWLQRNKVPYSLLVMRPNGNRTKSPEFKTKFIQALEGLYRTEVVSIIEGRSTNAKAIAQVYTFEDRAPLILDLEVCREEKAKAEKVDRRIEEAKAPVVNPTHPFKAQVTQLDILRDDEVIGTLTKTEEDTWTFKRRGFNSVLTIPTPHYLDAFGEVEKFLTLLSPPRI